MSGLAQRRPRIVLDAAAPRRSPRRLLLSGLALVLAALLGAWAGARWLADEPPMTRDLSQALEALGAERDRLAQELAIARRGSQVATEAGEQLKAQIVALESELAGVRSDVAFYQRLLGTGGERRGLAVHDLRLTPTASSAVYRFRLTLSQNLEKARVVEGSLALLAEGILDTRMVELDGAALGIRLIGDTERFRFKYFQEFEGSLELPAGFAPERLVVRLRAEERDEPIERRFEWSELTTAPVTAVATTMEES